MFEPKDDQQESQDDNELAFEENEFSSIQATSRIATKKRPSVWLSTIKLLSPAIVAVLLFFGFRHYLLPQTDTTPLPPLQQTRTQARVPSDLPQKKKTEKQQPAARQVDTKTQNANLDDREKLEIENEKPLAERPFNTKIAEVWLPSGRSVSSILLSPPEETEIGILQIRDTKHYYSKDENGRICAVCQYDHKSRKIDGLVMRTHTNGVMSSLASFHRSKRDGPLYCWNQNGQICYYCDWVNGNKQGLSCLFNDNEEPVLIQEWKANNLVHQYRVRYQDQVKPKAEEVTPNSEIIAPLKKQIAHLEQELDTADIELRRNFARDFKKMSQNVRIATSQPTPEKAAHIAQLSDAQQLKHQAAETVFWQRVTTGSQWSGKQRWLAPKARPTRTKETLRR